MGWDPFKSIKKAFERGDWVSWIATGGATAPFSAAGIKEARWLDPVSGALSAYTQKPEKAEKAPTAPEPPVDEEQRKNLLRIMMAKQQQASAQLIPTYGGTLSGSPLGIPGQAHIIRPFLTGK